MDKNIGIYTYPPPQKFSLGYVYTIIYQVIHYDTQVYLPMRGNHQISAMVPCARVRPTAEKSRSCIIADSLVFRARGSEAPGWRLNDLFKTCWPADQGERRAGHAAAQ